jgi:predicted heme/steroid binding protein
LIAIKDTIYDVSGVDYYRKNGAYDVFAGHDASINLSKMSHDPLFLNKWGSFTLTPE